MINIGSYLLASAYSATSPLLNSAISECSINGKMVPCDSLPMNNIFGGLMAFLGIFFFIMIILGVLMLVSQWKIYKKAGKPGWAVLVPIYNIIVLLEIVGKPIWWIFLMFIPFVNIIFGIIIANELSKSFGLNGWFTVGLVLLPFIFYPILAFGNYEYIRGVETAPKSDPSPVEFK
jgi:hypothetical protein